MDILSRHYLCVKFSLRLMHNIHSLIHVEKSILKGHSQQINANKNWFRKNVNILSARCLETMVTYNNQIRFLKFITLYSCTIDLILEELKDIKWIWHQEIRTPYMLLWHFLHYCVWYKPNSLNDKSIYTTLLLECYICAKSRLTYWYPCRKKKCQYFCTGVYNIDPMWLGLKICISVGVKLPPTCASAVSQVFSSYFVAF